jgi:hypothetical protein
MLVFQNITLVCNKEEPPFYLHPPKSKKKLTIMAILYHGTSPFPTRPPLFCFSHCKTYWTMSMNYVGLKICLLKRSISMLIRAALHLEAGLVCCVRGLKSSLVIAQKAQIGPNPFTPRGRADSVV